MLVCFSRFQQKEAVLHWARNDKLKYQGTVIRISQYLSTAIAKKRASYNGIKASSVPKEYAVPPAIPG